MLGFGKQCYKGRMSEYTVAEPLTEITQSEGY